MKLLCEEQRWTGQRNLRIPTKDRQWHPAKSSKISVHLGPGFNISYIWAPSNIGMYGRSRVYVELSLAWGTPVHLSCLTLFILPFIYIQYSQQSVPLWSQHTVTIKASWSLTLVKYLGGPLLHFESLLKLKGPPTPKPKGKAHSSLFTFLGRTCA